MSYHHPSFRSYAEKNGIFFGRYARNNERGVPATTEELCWKLIENDTAVPDWPGCIFSDKIFESACEMIEDRNEGKVNQDIARLIVPSPQTLFLLGMDNLRGLIESVDEVWANCIPILNYRPAPDFSVGFRQDAFSDEQRRRLSPFLGEDTHTSLFRATHYMLFPFLTCEVKSGTGVLEVADRQNAHGAAIAVKTVVQLFALVHRQEELHREILAFSVSHDNRTIRIYGHFPAIDGQRTTYHRHLIREFSFVEQRGKERWTAYKFTKGIYEKWMPTHLARISSAIDQIDLEVLGPQGSEQLSSSRSNLSQTLSQSEERTSGTDTYSQPSSVEQQPDVTPNTSLSHESKRPKRKRNKQ